MVTLTVVFALLAGQVFAANARIRGAIFSLEKKGGPVYVHVDATCDAGASFLIEETEEEFTTDKVDGDWRIEPTTLEADTTYTVTITCEGTSGRNKTVTTKYSLWFKDSAIKASRLKKAK
jgi:hypothetical protein